MRGYTLRQLKAFTTAAERARGRQLRETAIAHRVAAHAKDAGFNKYLEKLSG